MDETKNGSFEDRAKSYINHLAHIQNIPNPEQTQYMNYSHSVAWSFNKEKKRKSYIILTL
jgi:hypothetical protein